MEIRFTSVFNVRTLEGLAMYARFGAACNIGLTWSRCDFVENVEVDLGHEASGGLTNSSEQWCSDTCG